MTSIMTPMVVAVVAVVVVVVVLVGQWWQFDLNLYLESNTHTFRLDNWILSLLIRLGLENSTQ